MHCGVGRNVAAEGSGYGLGKTARPIHVFFFPTRKRGKEWCNSREIHTLSLRATTTAVTCSAALPTIGIKINPMKVLLMPELATSSSIEPTRYSAQMATAKVTTRSRTLASMTLITASSDSSMWPSGCSTTSGTKSSSWVRSWKTRYMT